MRVRKEGICESCQESLEGMAYEETRTAMGVDICSYECLENWYENDIPEEEDFIIN